MKVGDESSNNLPGIVDAICVGSCVAVISTGEIKSTEGAPGVEETTISYAWLEEGPHDLAGVVDAHCPRVHATGDINGADGTVDFYEKTVPSEISNDLPGIVDAIYGAVKGAEGIADFEKTALFEVAVYEISNDLPGIVNAICPRCQGTGDINGAEGTADFEKTALPSCAVLEISHDLPGIVDAPYAASGEKAGHLNDAEGAVSVEKTADTSVEKIIGNYARCEAS